jgi:autotransporter adhesin
MAVAGLPQAFRPGKGLVGMAIGAWGGQTAFAFGASKIFGDGRTVFKAGASFDSRGSGGANAGIGWQF